MKKIKITDDILIVFLTAISYFAYFNYQAGYYNYFNIPDFLVDVSIQNLLEPVPSMLLLVAMIYMLYTSLNTLIISLIPDTDYHIITMAKKYILYSVYGILILMLNVLKHKIVRYTIIILFILTIFFDFILPLYTQKKTKGYKNKLIAEIDNQVELSKSINTKNLINNVQINNIPVFAILILVFMLVHTFSYNLGETSAKNQKTYTLVNNEKVIIGTYKDYLIVKEIDLVENVLEQEFSLISNNENYKYSSREIENLVVED